MRQPIVSINSVNPKQSEPARQHHGKSQKQLLRYAIELEAERNLHAEDGEAIVIVHSLELPLQRHRA
jgi:hypothetical protein